MLTVIGFMFIVLLVMFFIIDQKEETKFEKIMEKSLTKLKLILMFILLVLFCFLWFFISSANDLIHLIYKNIIAI